MKEFRISALFAIIALVDVVVTTVCWTMYGSMEEKILNIAAAIACAVYAVYYKRQELKQDNAN